MSSSPATPRDRQPEASLAKQHPALIVEVLSDSTAAFDRGRKFEHYQQIDTLQEYLLVEQDRKHADLFRKNREGLWVLHPAGEGDAVRLESGGGRAGAGESVRGRRAVSGFRA
jgi:Uma2 family endonuclease